MLNRKSPAVLFEQPLSNSEGFDEQPIGVSGKK